MSRRCRIAGTAFVLMAASGLQAQQRQASPPAGKARTEAECLQARAQVTSRDAHQAMDHAAHQATLAACANAGPLPTSPGQAAFGAIAEVVRLLDADPNTDWSKVDVEALRQHLIDMDELIMRAAVSQQAVPGGLQLDVTGSGRTRDAIERMVANHGMMLDRIPGYAARSEPIPGGARLVVTARDVANTRAVARIRGLGFAGLFTEGDHHAAHHLLVARGEKVHHE